MKELKVLKQKLLAALTEQLEKKIDTLSIEIATTIDSRNNDTKSSAGDKFETGREMMQIELNKSEAQLNKVLKDKYDLSQINTTCTFTKVEFGSLVVTNTAKYFILLPLGKIIVDGEDIYCISLASPIGKAMMNKYEKESFRFQNKEFNIENVI